MDDLIWINPKANSDGWHVASKTPRKDFVAYIKLDSVLGSSQSKPQEKEPKT